MDKETNFVAWCKDAERTTLACSFCGWPLDTNFCPGTGPMLCATCLDIGDVLEARPYWLALHAAWMKENDALYRQKRRILGENRDQDRREGVI
jgi:hypothetical protein